MAEEWTEADFAELEKWMHEQQADRLLVIQEAARMLNTSVDWLYRQWRTLPFVVQLSPRQLRFSAKGIQRWLGQQQHGSKED
jgi:predicted DNA-binding transcriptional regulator AlpA